MATDTVPLQLLALPDDILLEILAHLPALSIVLACRRTCHKLDRLSRERHLWIKVFNQTKHLLRQPIVGELGGASELEKSICRTEMLERMWTDEDALRAPPCFRRYIPTNETMTHGAPVAIMEDYVVFRRINAYIEQQCYGWVSVHDWNGPIVFQITTAMTFPCIGGYMDLDTGTFYIPFPSECGLEVAGFQVDTRVDQIVEVVRYTLPTRHKVVRHLEPRNGFLCLDYGSPSDSSKIEIGVVDLKRGILFHFALAHLSSLLSQERSYPALDAPFIISTETHLIVVTGLVAFAIFERPANGQGIRTPSIGAILPAQEVTCLFPILTGRFPHKLHRLQVMPRSATSFVIVGTGEILWPKQEELQTTQTVIRAFSFNVSGGQPSFEEVCSLVPGFLIDFVLRSPPSTARYALGVLACLGEEKTGRKRKYFTLRLDLPDSERGSGSGNQCKMTLTKMQLTSVIDEEKEVAEFRCFNHFSGRVLLFVFSNAMLRADGVLDYLVG